VLADLGTNDALVISTAITAVPATLAAVLGILGLRQIRTPSGDTIGKVVERTHDLAAVSVAHTTELVTGHDAPEEDTP